MVARVTTLQLQPGKLDTFLRIAQDQIAPMLAAQPGFGGITLLTDAGLGKVVAVSLWDSQADLMAGEHVGDLTISGEINGLLAAAPLCELYDVGLQVELTAAGAAHIRGL